MGEGSGSKEIDWFVFVLAGCLKLGGWGRWEMGGWEMEEGGGGGWEMGDGKWEMGGRDWGNEGMRE